MKFGFVLEGGAMRAIYTAGVLDVLYDAGIRPDGLIGTSAGAIHGCSFRSGQPGRSIRYYKKYCKDRRFMSLWSLLTTGSIVGEKFCYYDLPERLDPFDNEAFMAADMEYYITCTELESGKAVYKKTDDLNSDIRWMLAGASMPFVSKKVKLEGKTYLDGGVADSIPIEAFRRMGYERNLVVLTQPAGYQKKPQNPKIAKLFYRKYPNFVQALTERHNSYNATLKRLEELEQAGEVLILRPSKDLGIKRIEKDPARIELQYQLGRSDAEAILDRLKAWLAKES